MKIEGIIFDLDGTLVDSIEDIGDSMNEILREYGIEELSYDEYKIKVGGGFNNLVIGCYGKEDKDVLKKLEDAYRRNYLNKIEPYENIEELLNELKDKEIKIGINTNKNQEYTDDIVKKLFPNIEFVNIIGKSKKIPVKPNTKGAEIIIKDMNIEKENILYIGDSNIDILTGKNLGVKTVGVNWGFRGEEELKEYGADYIVYDPLEILEII